ncbi:protein disulfide isomerase-like 1-4 [Citrus sinensis]|uniref:Protein disulfide isomerase-like 1-4 n=1 Tax=Citrus sinensis TaxID=2711 RepID=A0ACB8IUT3_CITSI|nr:protein disulfide isomerase-like 1-4 [Citrus sinensis]
MSTRYILLLSLTILLLFSPALAKSQNDAASDDDEDLSFLEEADPDTKSKAASHHQFGEKDGDPDDDDFSDDFDDENYHDFDDSEYKEPEIDDKDVVVLKERNFSDVIENNKFVMVEFYAPWCGHCQALAPEYAAAATELKSANESVVLAKVDATEENELAHEYDVQGFPTIYFFVDGQHKAYNGGRTKDAIVTWIKKKIGPGIYNITTLDEAERVLTSETKVVLGYLNSLVGSESEVLADASRLEDDVNFYQTTNPDVAKIFHLDSEVNRPALVMVKKEAEKISYFDGKFDKSTIADFVFSNKLPLVTIFTRENAPSVFESPIKNQLLLFAVSNDSEKLLPVFEEAAKSFKGKLIFVYVQMDNEDVGKPVSEYFGITGEAPKTFGEDFLEGKVKPFFKSDPIPETNDGDVKIVVGNNFDEIVLDESKDVLLEIYAPWCGHCQAFEPTYNKLAKHLRGVDSIVIAKMDGTTNEHHRAKINVDVDRTVVALYKFLKKNASIPFKIQKPTSAPKTEKPTSEPKAESSDIKESHESSSDKDVKDEL